MNKKKYLIRFLIAFFIVCAITCLMFFYKDNIIHISNLIFKGDLKEIKIYLKSIGLKGLFILSLIQAMQIVFAVLPSEFVQVSSILVYGKVLGFISMYIAVILGSSIVYGIVKLFKVNYKKIIDSNSLTRLENSNFKSSDNLTKIIIGLYFAPLIPYGVISYFYSSHKVNYFKFLIVTAISIIPSLAISLLISVSLRAILIKLGVAMLLIAIILWIILTVLKKYKINFENNYAKGVVRKPNKFLFFILRIFLAKPMYKKHNVKFDITNTKDLKPPFVVLCSHPSKFDFVYAAKCIEPYNFYTVTNRYYFYNKYLKYLLQHVGVIPKNLFAPDIQTIKSIMKVIKNDGVVLMMPEGKLSTLGKQESINESLSKLLKNLKVDVMSINIGGAYYTNGKWRKSIAKGEISVKSDILFTKEQIENLSNEEIDESVKKALYYDDSIYLEKHKNITYQNDNLLQNLSSMLYVCPKCHKEFTLETNHNQIKCKCCDYVSVSDNRYNLTGNDLLNITSLQKFYDFQLSYTTSLVNQENFKLISNVELRMPSKKNRVLEIVGSGVCQIDKEMFVYKGSMHDTLTEIKIPTKTITAIPFEPNDSFEFYRNNTFYSFIPQNTLEAVKWSFIADALNKGESK